TAAREWQEHERDDAYLWVHERLEPVYAMLERLKPGLDENVRAFIQPEHERLLVEFADPRTEQYRRQAIGDRLLIIGPVTVRGLLDALHTDHSSIRRAAAEPVARFSVR